MLLSSFSIADGHYVIDGNYDYDRTATRTYAKKQCWQGYKHLKKILKDDAKQYCVSQGSHGTKLLIMKKWNKLSCIKNRERGRRTTVTVKARFRSLCN